MVLTFKNKFQIALDGVIEEGIKVGGIPDKIVLDPTEAWQLLKELSYFYQQPSYIDNFDLQHTADVSDLRFILPQLLSYDKPKAKQLLKQWMCNKYTIKYKNVPLIICLDGKK